jgi:hypothetical protein
VFFANERQAELIASPRGDDVVDIGVLTSLQALSDAENGGQARQQPLVASVQTIANCAFRGIITILLST